MSDQQSPPSSFGFDHDGPAVQSKQDCEQAVRTTFMWPLRTWVGPVVAGALMRIGVWALGRSGDRFLSPDSHDYWRLAGDVSVYSTLDGPLLETALLRVPGYPLILALFRLIGNNYATAALLQSLVGVLAVFMTYQVALRLLNSWVASVAAWWLAVEPLHVVESSILLTEVTFSVLLMGAILVLTPLASRPLPLLPMWRWLVAGLFIAAATFVRAISLYLPLLVLLCAVVIARYVDRRRMTLGILMFLVAFGLPVGLWFAHIHAATGVATFSTIQGANLAFYRAVGAMVHGDGLPVEEARQEMRRLVEEKTTAGMNPADVAQVQTSVGTREIVKRPVGYAVSTIRGLLYTLFGPGRADIRERLAIQPWQSLTLPITAISFASAIASFAFSAFGIWLLIRRRRWVPLLLLVLPVGYLLMVGSGQESDSRFRVPIEPVLMILAGIAVNTLASLKKQRGIGLPAKEVKNSTP